MVSGESPRTPSKTLIFLERVPRKGSESPGNPQRIPLRIPLRVPRPHLPWGCSCGDGEDACHAVLSALHTYAHPFFGQRHCNAHFGKRSPRITFASVWSRSGKPRHRPRTSNFWLTQRTASCKRSSSSQGDQPTNLTQNQTSPGNMAAREDSLKCDQGSPGSVWSARRMFRRTNQDFRSVRMYFFTG